ncbi:MAG: tRNA 2-selenouridine(34) synthase MnmH [Bacteroidia bacterium]|nr:tRNA 2-selenouridine(34) synthase MnmH [Bacteroidia bacterium]MDW8159765.1 tRNA 2-selenouridine(34) synthase MnmH [Bacteroidia bacterium]
MIQELGVEQFLRQSPIIIDVRSPKEYESGHIPFAVNLPLFSNEERALIGTIYKAQGKQAAILEGLDIVGPRMSQILQAIRALGDYSKVGLHCWRGGKRSSSVAWLLALYGLEVYLLQGGYKKFRQFVLNIFSEKLGYIILGGKTGSGKTIILELLKQQGQAAINLEAIACHKGSAFGFIGEKEQPTQEQFENELGMEIFKCLHRSIIWLEDESRFIGRRFIPNNLFLQMRQSPVIYLDIPLEVRIEMLVQNYGRAEVSLLEQGIEKLQKRLGGLRTKAAKSALNRGDLYTTCQILLEYYDKTYEYGLAQRDENKVIKLSFACFNPNEIVSTLLEIVKEKSLIQEWKKFV